jgi:hypothetical protein
MENNPEARERLESGMEKARRIQDLSEEALLLYESDNITAYRDKLREIEHEGRGVLAAVSRLREIEVESLFHPAKYIPSWTCIKDIVYANMERYRMFRELFKGLAEKTSFRAYK